MKILNLYSGIGGNREKWGSEHEITSVENDSDIAEVYKTIYPQDNIIACDAHVFLEENYKEFDFIWSSPPCPSHGQYRHNVGVLGKGFDPIMPNMKLYAEIVFLQFYFKGKWVVENVKPYYSPLIKELFCLNRHLFWANFTVDQKIFKPSKIRSKNKISDFDNSGYVIGSKIKNKRQVLRNCVNPDLGKYILEQCK